MCGSSELRSLVQLRKIKCGEAAEDVSSLLESIQWPPLPL